MSLRQTVFENLIDDLNYDPKRGLIYLFLAFAALYVGFRVSFEARLDFIAPVLAFGGAGILLKGIFLLRKNSKGLGAATPQLSLTEPKPNITVPQFEEPPWPTFGGQFTQLIQDFGTGPLLLGPILSTLKDLNESWEDVPAFSVFLTGLTLVRNWLDHTALSVVERKRSLGRLRHSGQNWSKGENSHSLL